MSFTDDLKRSLGFEETNSSNKNNDGPGFIDMIRDTLNNVTAPKPQHDEPQQQYNPEPRDVHTPRTVPNPQYKPTPKAEPIFEDDFEVIIPEQSFYEIVLIRPKTIDDINYVVDQVIEEQNPVILDLSFLEKESAPNFKLAGDKIKQMRAKYGAQALLLSRTEEKNLIIISPRKVKVINKG
jgi:SepF-like predicted cell division protein (DUF552 family)